METWITSKEEKGHLLEGLTAGQTYVWVELEAPAGYLLMKPVLFTVSEDGRSIVSISNNLSAIRVDTVKGSPGHPFYHCGDGEGAHGHPDRGGGPG